jgi:hypothetical protein
MENKENCPEKGEKHKTIRTRKRNLLMPENSFVNEKNSKRKYEIEKSNKKTR